MILIDTHVVLWTTHDASQLSVNASRALAEARLTGGVAIADITLRELAFLTIKRRITIDMPLDHYLGFVESVFHVLPINGRIAERSLNWEALILAIPAGQIIGATAIVHGMQLVTKDAGIRRSGEVDCLW